MKTGFQNTSPSNPSNPSIRILKCWQTTDFKFIMQAQSPPSKEKRYIIIDLGKPRAEVSLNTSRPDNLQQNGALQVLVRKYFPTGRLIDIQQNDVGYLVMVLERGLKASGEYTEAYLVITNDKPPLLQFIVKGQGNLIRWGQKGSYTKRQEEEGWDHQIGPLKSVLSDYWNFDSKSQLEEQSEKSQQTAIPEDHSLTFGFNIEQRTLRDRVARKLKTVKKSLSKQEADCPSLTDLDLLRAAINQLQTESYNIPTAATHWEIKLPQPDGTEKSYEFELDSNVSVGENISRHFIHLKKLTKRQLILSKRITDMRLELQRLEANLHSLRTTPLEITALQKIAADLKLPFAHTSTPGSSLSAQFTRKSSKQQQAPEKSYWRTYALSDGKQLEVVALVGKNAAANDILTKQAKGHDTWFHVVGAFGSHVIIPHSSHKHRDLTAPIIHKAAILALHFSERNKDFGGEVYVTKKQHLRKTADLPAGKWNILKSESVFVRYSESELKELLDSLKG